MSLINPAGIKLTLTGQLENGENVSFYYHSSGSIYLGGILWYGNYFYSIKSGIPKVKIEGNIYLFNPTSNILPLDNLPKSLRTKIWR